MSMKRSLQSIKRQLTAILINRRVESKYFLDIKETLDLRVPNEFDSALFNFTIDFELCWGNGNLAGCAHPKERRVEAGARQSSNFIPFTSMLKEINFPITWAVLGKLADHKITPPDELKFTPRWSVEDWYDDSFQKLQSGIWNGEKYLDCIKNELPFCEVQTHGHAHIDYSDSETSEEIAYWDLKTSIDVLKKYGFNVNSFVYPCNKHGHKKILKEMNIQIIRGQNNSWIRDGDHIETPLGFWISPGIFSVKEIKKLIDIAIENKSFIHPWMHLIECDLNENDIENFYRPIFEYIKLMHEEGRIRNISFSNIASGMLR